MTELFYNRTPGPDHYEQAMRSTWRSAPAYTLKGRPRSLSSFAGPAPNVYSPYAKNVLKRPPSFSFRARTALQSQKAMVAPNQYTPGLYYSYQTITMSARYSRPGNFYWDLDHNKSVGPAYYLRSTDKMPGRFSMKSRHPETYFGRSTPGTGPAGYDKAKASTFVRRAAPKYSMKSRSADPKAPTRPPPNAYTCQSPWKHQSAAFSFKGRHEYSGVNHGSIEFRYKMFLLQ